ncbi:MAG: hypothetical protein COA36_09805 [Desulfotalea sp.]|nr:MAG: hypothetical protein COA36_09805 [Desulfotalea sp.]
MKYFTNIIGNVEIKISTFEKNDTCELHFFIKTIEQRNPTAQFEEVIDGLKSYLEESNIAKNSVVFSRFFVSDAANQEASLLSLADKALDAFDGCAVSVVQQPPLCTNNKVVLWAYAIHSKGSDKIVNKEVDENHLILRRKGYEHVWTTQLSTDNGATDSYSQTQNIFENYTKYLAAKGHSLERNCLRTWLFVKDIDFNYGGVVTARSELFTTHGMTPETHFISSTGIEGRHISPNVNVLMDAYSVLGVEQDQIKFLTAPDHLNPTHEYGVTFERGTSVDYGDRRHVFISGTASIDSKGKILHVEDVAKQVERVGENISALLADADSSTDDIAQMVIYLRDLSDTDAITPYLDQHYGKIPKIVVHAPVCRPGWLIEIECMAIQSSQHPQFENF